MLNEIHEIQHLVVLFFLVWNYKKKDSIYQSNLNRRNLGCVNKKYALDSMSLVAVHLLRGLD